MAFPMKSEYGNNFSDVVMGWLTEKLWIDSQQWQHISIYFETYRALGVSIQPPLACISTFSSE
jgi:hypothetical protein